MNLKIKNQWKISFVVCINVKNKKKWTKCQKNETQNILKREMNNGRIIIRKKYGNKTETQIILSWILSIKMEDGKYPRNNFFVLFFV